MTPRWTLSIVAALTLGASVPADAATIQITMENLVISPAETSAMHIFCGQAFEQNCGAGARFYLPPGARYYTPCN
jgi:hypothetical protein